MSSYVILISLFVHRYDSEGKGSPMASVGTGMSPSARSGGRSMYSDRVFLSHITENLSLGEEKVLYHQFLIVI